jgi:hypothetical protein
MAASHAITVTSLLCCCSLHLLLSRWVVVCKYLVLHLQLTAQGAVAAVGVHELAAINSTASRSDHTLRGPGLGAGAQEQHLGPIDHVVLDTRHICIRTTPGSQCTQPEQEREVHLLTAV